MSLFLAILGWLFFVFAVVYLRECILRKQVEKNSAEKSAFECGSSS